MRGETIQRAFEIIKMFESGPVTARMLMSRLDISKQSANRWIMQASRFLPIRDVGFDRSHLGRPGIIYELIRGRNERI